MLRMPPFEVHLPRTVADAVALRGSLPAAMYVAGGTDLLPNLKHALHQPNHLVSLAGVDGLDEVGLDPDGALRIGARCTLHRVATDPLARRRLPALAQAASLVAGPQHRRMGTIGGNVMLDTRCLFYNQSQPWRASIGYCLKASGTWCHVIGSAKSCVAAQSSDTVPVLVAADAAIEAVGAHGPVRVALRDLWTKDGRFDANRTLEPGALVTAIVVPAPGEGHRSAYRKVRSRGAVDFPQLGIAAVGRFDGAGRCDALDVVIGAMLPHPKRVDGLGFAVGAPLTDDVVAAVAELAFKSARPQSQIHGDPSWRRHMVRVETRRALESLRGGAPA